MAEQSRQMRAERWAAFVGHSRWVWIVIWPALGGLIWVTTPRISELLHDSQIGFLPPDMPSQQAIQTLHREFPQDAYASRAVLVCVRAPGLDEADRAWIAGIAGELALDRRGRGWRIKGAAVTPLLAPLLESRDGQASLIVVDLPAELYTHHTVDSVGQIKTLLADRPPPAGLVVEVTGSGALGELLAARAKQNVDNTTFWTFLSVIVILAVIYRSPVAMGLPVLTVAASLMISLGLIGWGASHGLPISGLVEMFVIVVVVGSGVDYCLFLFARFREAIAVGVGPAEAARMSLARCSGAILASAGTNVAGLATLILARNRDVYTTGPTIAFAIAIATLAILTLAPALMQVAGHRLLWPARIRARREGGGVWSAIGALVVRRPTFVLLLCLLVLALPAVAGLRVESNYDTLDEYPPDTSFVRGARLAYRHLYGVEDAAEVTVLLTFTQAPGRARFEAALRPWLDAYASSLQATLGDRLLYVRHAFDPLGKRTGGGGEPPGEGQARTALADDLVSRLGRSYYVSTSGRAVRIDVGLAAEAHSSAAMAMVERVRRVADAVALGEGQAAGGVGLDPVVLIAGDTAVVEDMRALKAWDFSVVATAAVLVVYAILFWLLRDWLLSALLVGATLLTFAAACGLTWAVFYTWTGLDGLNFRLDFLLFIILLSLGQDYNIYVVTRIREELRHRGPAEAVALAVGRTGGVVSSCGIIMAATFASMVAGSLIVMKQMAIGLALGILLDTFVVRPLLVPAATYLLLRRRIANAE